MKLAELAPQIDAELLGQADCDVFSVAEPHNAQNGQVIFVKNHSFAHHLQSTQASAVILPQALADQYQGNKLIAANPYLAYAKAATLLHKPKRSLGIHEQATIHPTAQIGKEVSIAANAVIEAGCVIGDACFIGAGVYIGENTTIGKACDIRPNANIASNTVMGNGCTIHMGAVIGSDGFGFAPQADKTWYKIPQIGNVILGNDVEVGANTTIDNGAIGSTKIGNGVKLDNLIQIAHNVEIGDHSALAAHTAIAGSVKIGQYCQIGGASAIAGHLTIADHVVVLATSFVTQSIHEASVYSSAFPVADAKKWRRNVVRFNHLDEMHKRLSELEDELRKL